MLVCMRALPTNRCINTQADFGATYLMTPQLLYSLQPLYENPGMVAARRVGSSITCDIQHPSRDVHMTASGKPRSLRSHECIFDVPCGTPEASDEILVEMGERHDFSVND